MVTYETRVQVKTSELFPNSQTYFADYVIVAYLIGGFALMDPVPI